MTLREGVEELAKELQEHSSDDVGDLGIWSHIIADRLRSLLEEHSEEPQTMMQREPALPEHFCVLQSARAVRDFCKYEDYPELYSAKWHELTCLIDRLDIELRRFDAAAVFDKTTHPLDVCTCCDSPAREGKLTCAEHDSQEEAAWDEYRQNYGKRSRW